MSKIFYLAQIFNALHTLGTVIFAFGLAAVIMLGIALMVEDGSDDIKTGFKFSLVVTILGLLATVFVPTRETYLFMKAGDGVEQFVNSSDSAKELPSNTIDLLNEYIKAETAKVKEKSNE